MICNSYAWIGVVRFHENEYDETFLHFPRENFSFSIFSPIRNRKSYSNSPSCTVRCYWGQILGIRDRMMNKNEVDASELDASQQTVIEM